MSTSGSDCDTHELNTMNKKSDSSSITTSGRKLLLRPIIPRPVLPINNSISTGPYSQNSLSTPNPNPNPNPPASSSCNCFFLPKSNTLISTSTTDHYLAPIEEDQSKQENNATAPLVTASSRWNPTPEQLRALEDMYEGGTRTPTADQIKLIAGMLRRFGKIEGKNVFYWFQNHKARERQKRRRRDHWGSTLQTEEPGFEVGQAKNNATSNFSTNSEDSVSIHRAVEASASRAQQGWIQLEEEEERELLQQRRRIARTTQSKRATWQLMEPSPTPQAFQFMATTTSSTAPPEEALNLSMNLAPSNNSSSFEEDQGGNPPTLQLFPIRTRDWRAEKGDYEASMASIDTSFVPNQFFEFLPMRN